LCVCPVHVLNALLPAFSSSADPLELRSFIHARSWQHAMHP
jgi:hypothetical protein